LGNREDPRNSPDEASACRRSPRCQTVIAASATKITSNSKLDWPISIQGFGTLGDSDRFTEERDVSQCCDLPVVEIRCANKIEDQRQRPQAADSPGQPQPPGPQIEPHESDQRQYSTQAGTWAHRTAMPNAPGVSARIIHNSHP